MLQNQMTMVQVMMIMDIVDDTMIMVGMDIIRFLMYLFQNSQYNSMASDTRFEEKILYKTHQHWIVAVSHSLKILLIGVLPLTLLTYVLVDYSMLYTVV